MEERLGEWFDAAREGDVERMVQLSAAGVAPSAREEDSGNSALHLAAWHGRVGCVRTLLDLGADVALRSWDGALPIHFAARHPEALAVFLGLPGGRVSADARSNEGFVPLTEAFNLSFGSSFREADPDGVLVAERLSSIRMLVEAGADVDGRNLAGRTRLMEAARCGSAEMVSLLFELGASGEGRCSKGLGLLEHARDERIRAACLAGIERAGVLKACAEPRAAASAGI